jgi:hypothetical protein
MFNQSEKIDLIAAAFVDCQSKLEAVPMGAENPFFKSKYADLAAVVAATRPVLFAHGLAVTQVFCPSETEKVIVIETVLIHKSGQFWSGVLTMPLDKATPQATGAAMTYARRYCYSALLGVITEKDLDGEDTKTTTAEPKASDSTDNDDLF